MCVTPVGKIRKEAVEMKMEQCRRTQRRGSWAEAAGQEHSPRQGWALETPWVLGGGVLEGKQKTEVGGGARLSAVLAQAGSVPSILCFPSIPCTLCP